MTLEKVKQVVADYAKILDDMGWVKNEQFTTPWQLPTTEDMLDHARWMCDQVADMDDVEKAMRWLGFIQGIFWAVGRRTIDEMRDDNRTS